MSNTSIALPDPLHDPERFDGLLTRRVIAHAIDLAVLAVISGAIWLFCTLFGVFTLGLLWLAMPVLIPLATLAYYAATLGGRGRSTVGMAMMDLELTPTSGVPLEGWAILLHPILFWITFWFSWPISIAVVLFTPRRQMLHDLLTGTLMLRRSPSRVRGRAVLA